MSDLEQASKSKTQAAMKDFKFFSKLAPEIRDMVWELILPPPNIITIYQKGSDESKAPHFVSSYKIPSILHVCQGSRKIGLKTYELAFKPNFWNPNHSCGGVYFDFARDALFFTQVNTANDFFDLARRSEWSPNRDIPWEAPDTRLRSIIIGSLVVDYASHIDMEDFYNMGCPNVIFYIRLAPTRHYRALDSARRTYKALCKDKILYRTGRVPELTEDGMRFTKDDNCMTLVVTGTMKNVRTYLGITEPKAVTTTSPSRQS